MVLFEQRTVYSRAVVVAVDERLRDEPHEIVVAREILGVQTEVASSLGLVPVTVVAVRDVHLASENRLDLRQPLEVLLRRVAGVVKRLEREQVAVVGHSYRGHPPPAGPLDQRIYLALPVKQGVCRVEMEMCEIAHVTSPRS